MLRFLLLMGLMSVCASSQEALVAELSREESANAAELHKRLVTAQKEWDDYKIAIRDKYGSVLVKNLPPLRRTRVQESDGTSRAMPSAWMGGIEFSTDYRFAVPQR